MLACLGRKRQTTGNESARLFCGRRSLPGKKQAEVNASEDNKVLVPTVFKLDWRDYDHQKVDTLWSGRRESIDGRLISQRGDLRAMMITNTPKAPTPKDGATGQTHNAATGIELYE